MDDTYALLASRIAELLEAKPNGRLLVGVAGPPGCGKSTIAQRVAARLNAKPAMITCKRPDGSGPLTIERHAVVVSIDGFHLTRAQLAAMPNAGEAFARRGAPWTFDADGVLDFVKCIRASSDLPIDCRPQITAPSFNHAIKDPVPDDIVIQRQSNVVILEHNYLLLNQGKWKTISGLLDFRIFVDVDEAVARERVARRHVQAGIEPTLELGRQRFDSNDALNGRLIRDNVTSFDIRVQSMDLIEKV